MNRKRTLRVRSTSGPYGPDGAVLAKKLAAHILPGEPTAMLCRA
ncbi:hypothetical protein ABZ611_27710 [Streptomyces sp. NPDC007861]